MPVPEPLIVAYKAAQYVVFGQPELVLRVGEPSPALDALLEAHRAATAAFVTAANPRGERRSLAENVVAFQSLKNAIKRSRCVFFEGEGRDPANQWHPEGSVLVLGIARAEAEALGRRFAQNAIVFVAKGGAPELVLLA